MEKMVVFGLIRSMHDLFTVIWVGGMLTTVIALMPALREIKETPKASMKILCTYQKMLSNAAIVSMIGLWITGMLLGKQSGLVSRFIGFSNSYETLISIKHFLVILMVIIALIRRFGLGRHIETLTVQQRKHYMGLLLINTLLGVLVIFLSGISSVFHTF